MTNLLLSDVRMTASVGIQQFIIHQFCYNYIFFLIFVTH